MSEKIKNAEIVFDAPTTRPVEIYKVSFANKLNKYPAFILIWVMWFFMLIGAFFLGDPILIVAVLLVDTVVAVLLHSAFSYLVDIREYLFQMSNQIEKRSS